MKLKISTFVVFALLTACATGYQQSGITGGFSETQLSPNVFRVTFRGNGYTAAERAEDFTLLRSAELALSNGFTHFIIVDASSKTEISSYTTPTQTETHANASVYGNSVYGSSRSTTTGGQTYIYHKPSSSNTIVCFKGQPEGQGMAYDARFLYDSLTRKYGIQTNAGH